MLKNKMKKILATVLASFLTLSVVGCGGEKNSVPEESTKIRGMHERTVSETDVMLAKDAKTDYVIVIGENETNDAVLFAVDELKQNFFRATGAILEIKYDSEIAYQNDTKVLSIGETSLLQTAGVTFDKAELGPSGYVVQTKGNSVFMVGATGNGSLYAVYGWLREQFEYEYYSIGEVYIQKDLAEEKLLNVTLKDKPDFTYRLTNFGEAWFDETVARRAQVDASNSLWVNFDGVEYHTSFNIVPPEMYFEEHRNWYSRTGHQLCFPQDPGGLADVVAARMIEGFKEFPDRNIATFTQQDHNSWCDCDLCRASLEKYGTNSAVYVQFVNRVAEQIEAWVQAECPERDILIAMFAYQQTEDAPVKETKKGYEPIDDSVRLRDNVALFYCPIYANYYYTFNDKENVKEATTLNKWNALSKNLFVWMYGANFRIYMAPYNNFSSMQENYRFLYDRGAKYLFDQQQFNQVSGTGWYKLRAYLSNKLQWQIDQDQTKLINDFFDNYYKDASAVMKRLFDEENTWFAYLAEHHGYTGNVSYTLSTLVKEEFWPQGLLEGWLALIDEAYAAIAPLKVSNPSLYDTLKDRITLESLTFRYMQLELYDVFYSENDVQRMKQSLKDDCTSLGVRQYSEQVSMDEYWG